MTNIGGRSYTDVGNSSSPLLLKSNGSIKCQWGNKLIDLIKDGKIATTSSSPVQITQIDQIEEIDGDGIFLVAEKEVWISVGDQKINLTNSDNSYISFLSKQELSVEEKQVALNNIGFYYKTLKEVPQVDSGIVFITSENKLYLINDGQILPYQMQSSNIFESVTIGSIKISDYLDDATIRAYKELQILVNDIPYLSFRDNNIYPLKDVVLQDGISLKSENASLSNGFRLYNTESAGSTLEVDNLIVRNKDASIISLSYENLVKHINEKGLYPGQVYRIIDFQNHWELTNFIVESSYVNLETDEYYEQNVFPLIVTAKNNAELEEVAYYEDHPEWSIIYHVFDESLPEGSKGIITQLTDEFNNTCNYDFKRLRFLCEDGVYRYTFDSGNPKLGKYNYEEETGIRPINIFGFLPSDEDYSLTGNVQNNNIYISNLKIDIDYGNEAFINYNNNENGENPNYLILQKGKDKQKFINNTISDLQSEFFTKCEFSGNQFLGTISGKVVIGHDITNNICNGNISEKFSTSGIINNNTFNGDIKNTIFKGENNIFYDELENVTICEVTENAEEITVTKDAIFFGNIFYKKVSELKVTGSFSDNVCDNTFSVGNVAGTAIFNKFEQSVENLTVSIEDVPTTTLEQNTFMGEVNNLTILNNTSFNSFKSFINNVTLGKVTSNVFTGSISESVLNNNDVASNTTGVNQNTFYNNIFNVTVTGSMNANIFRNGFGYGSEISGIINFSDFGYLVSNLDCTTNATIYKCSFLAIKDVTVMANLSTCIFQDIQSSTFNADLLDCTFYNMNQMKVNASISDCTFHSVYNTGINQSITKCTFQDISNTEVNASISDCTFHSELNGYNLTSGTYPPLIKVGIKEVYPIPTRRLRIIFLETDTFLPGMIIMWSGQSAIPEGWHVCDGKKGTPNLVGRFIKGKDTTDRTTTNTTDLDDNNELILEDKHLPAHTHDHLPHTHTVSGTINNSGELSVQANTSYIRSRNYNTGYAVTSCDSESDSGQFLKSVSGTSSSYGWAYGGDHSHNFNLTIQETTTEQKPDQRDPEKIKIEPHAYSLIFIMKLNNIYPQ